MGAPFGSIFETIILVPIESPEREFSILIGRGIVIARIQIGVFDFV